MAGTRAAIRYAKAVLSLASDNKVAEAVNDDMKLISNTISNSQELDDMLKSAVIKTEAKKGALNKLFPKVNSITSGMFDVLVSNKRINILGNVAEKYSVLFDELNNKEIATVTTAVPMDAALEEKVLAKIKTLTTKTVEVNNVVDETILGGFMNMQLLIFNLQHV